MRRRVSISCVLACLGLLLLAETVPAQPPRTPSAWIEASLSLEAPLAGPGMPAQPEASADAALEAAGWQTIMSDGFEGAFPSGWILFDDNEGHGEYLWAKRDCRAQEGTHSAWAVGGGRDGHSLACGSDYPDEALSWMAWGPFGLESANGAELTFQLWLSVEEGFDRLFVARRPSVPWAFLHRQHRWMAVHHF